MPKIELRIDQWEEHEKTRITLHTAGFMFFATGIIIIGAMILEINWLIYGTGTIQILLGVLVERTHAQWSKKHGQQ